MELLLVAQNDRPRRGSAWSSKLQRPRERTATRRYVTAVPLVKSSRTCGTSLSERFASSFMPFLPGLRWTLTENCAVTATRNVVSAFSVTRWMSPVVHRSKISQGEDGHASERIGDVAVSLAQRSTRAYHRICSCAFSLEQYQCVGNSDTHRYAP